MIRITRPTTIPTVLTTRGVQETISNEGKYTASFAAYNSGKNNFKIKGSIYNAPTVKSTLKKAQHQKCCFCEKLQGDEYGAVEHYRPKNGYKAKRKDRLKKPGYYWYGYLWSNLLFVCSPCNTKKGNIFPIEDEMQRVKNHNPTLNKEVPLLLDPTGRKDPRKHIVFDNQFIRGVSEYGRQTIEICNLDRYSLNEERLRILNEIEERILIIIDNSDAAAVNRAIAYLKNSIRPTAPFSAMAQDYIGNSPIVIT